MSKKKLLTRRDFLKKTGGVVAGTALASTVGTSNVLGQNKELNFWCAWAKESPKTERTTKQIIKEFKKDTGIQVKLQAYSYDVMRQKLLAAVRAGQAPDICESGALGIHFFYDGLTKNVEPLIPPELKKDLHPGAMKAVAMPGGNEWWGIPFVVEMRPMLGHTEIMSKYGWSLEDVNSWSQFLKACQDLTHKDKKLWGTALFGAPWDLEQWWAYCRSAVESPGDTLYLEQNGDGKWHANITGRVRGITRFYVDLFKRFKVAHPSSPSLTDEKADLLLARGNVAMKTNVHATPFKESFPDLYKPRQEIIKGRMLPVLTEELGKKYGHLYPELVGKKGCPGTHMCTVETTLVVFGKKSELASDFLQYLLKPDQIHRLALAYDEAPLLTKSALKECVERGYELGYRQIEIENAKAALQYQENIMDTFWPIAPANKIRWDILNSNVSSALAGD